MSDLQDALDRNQEVFEPTWEESMLFAEAARRVANLDIERAVKAYMAYTATDERTARFGVERIMDALGITTEDK